MTAYTVILVVPTDILDMTYVLAATAEAMTFSVCTTTYLGSTDIVYTLACAGGAPLLGIGVTFDDSGLIVSVDTSDSNVVATYTCTVTCTDNTSSATASDTF